MKAIYQDVTFTLDVTNMGREEYKRIIAIANALDEAKAQTHTYSSEDGDLDKSQQAQMNMLYGK